MLISGPTARGQTQSGATAPKPLPTADKPLLGKELANTVCTSCHGPTGNNPDLQYPKIAGLARFYSRQKVKPDKIKGRRLADLGRRIFNYSGRGVPACAACHSPGGYGPGMMKGSRGGTMGGGMMHGGMMGNPAAVPNLFGQHAIYTVGQLDAFASGKRRGTVIGTIAARLTPHERQAVAEYLAGRR